LRDEPGPKNQAIGVTEPLDCFHLLLPEDFYDKLIAETNRYASQQRELCNDHSPWNPVSREELMAFVGLVIAMGIVSLPSLTDYWSMEPMHCHSWFRLVMPRDRFIQILRYIHVVDNNTALPRTDPRYDKLWKIRPLIDCLGNSIDESMIGTKCRLSFIQYLPKKPAKWGIKVWACCDAITGYIYAFEVYTGADKSVPKSIHGQGYDVVMSLMSPLLGKGYAVYTDNFYSSPQLFQDLLDSKTSASGTVRRNRKHFPENLDVTSKMNRGDCKFLHCGSLTICRWCDNKDVFCLSTCFSDSTTTIRRRVDKELKDVACPNIVVDYNKHMGGVDLADKAMCYSIGRKTMKWWRVVILVKKKAASRATELTSGP